MSRTFSSKLSPQMSACWVVLAIALSSACADPEGAYDDFNDRYVANQAKLDASVSDSAGPDASSPDAIDQDGAVDDVVAADQATPEAAVCEALGATDVTDPYLFSLSAKLLPTSPILCVGTLKISQGASGPEVSFEIQPLLVSDKKTPVGEPIVGGPFPIQADGSFVAEFGAITVAGAANPISGSDLETTVTLTGAAGAMCKPADFICGDVSGTVSKPLTSYDLSGGSRFTFQRITDPDTYPVAVIDCQGTQAP